AVVEMQMRVDDQSHLVEVVAVRCERGVDGVLLHPVEVVDELVPVPIPVSNSSNPVGCRNANARTDPVSPCNGCEVGNITSATCNGTTSSSDRTTDATL